MHIATRMGGRVQRPELGEVRGDSPSCRECRAREKSRQPYGRILAGGLVTTVLVALWEAAEESRKNELNCPCAFITYKNSDATVSHLMRDIKGDMRAHPPSDPLEHSPRQRSRTPE